MPDLQMNYSFDLVVFKKKGLKCLRDQVGFILTVRSSTESSAAVSQLQDIL